MCTFRVWRSREVGRGLPMKYRVSCLLSDRFSPLVKKISSCFPDETRTESSFSCLPKENLSILEQHLFNIHPTLVSFVEAVPRACATTPRQTIFRSCIVFFFRLPTYFCLLVQMDFSVSYGELSRDPSPCLSAPTSRLVFGLYSSPVSRGPLQFCKLLLSM